MFRIIDLARGARRAFQQGMRPQRFLLQTTLLLAAGVAASSIFAQESTGSNRWRKVAAADESQPAPALSASINGESTAQQPQQQQQELQQRPAAPAPAPAAPSRPAPGQIVIPAGTWVTVRVDQLLSSEYNRPGDAFGATLSQPIIADGFVVARRGQTITGRITEAIRAGKVKGSSRLGVEISDLSLSDGQQVPVRTQLVEFSAGTSKGNDTAIVGTTTGVGAAIGAAAGGGFGAGMGAIAGAGASAIGLLLSRGRATEVPPESVMRFRLLEPVTVNTERSQHAFQTVRQDDFDSRPLQSRVQVRQPQRSVFWGGGPFFYDPWMWGPGWGWGGGWGPGWGWGPRYNTVFVGGRGWGGRGWGGRGWGGGGRRR